MYRSLPSESRKLSDADGVPPENADCIFRFAQFRKSVAAFHGNKSAPDFDKRKTQFGKTVESCDRPRNADIELFAQFFVMSEVPSARAAATVTEKSGDRGNAVHEKQVFRNGIDRENLYIRGELWQEATSEIPAAADVNDIGICGYLRDAAQSAKCLTITSSLSVIAVMFTRLFASISFP